MFSKCDQVLGEEDVFFTVSRFVALETRFVVEARMRPYLSAVFKQVPDAERDVRQQPSLGGVALNTHFVEHAGSNWKVWSCVASHLEQFDAFVGEELHLSAKASIGRLMGVTPCIIERRPDRRAELSVAAAAAEGEFPDDPLEAAQGSDLHTDHVVQASLRGLYETIDSGAIDHKFSVSGLLSGLDFASHLKPSASLNDALAAAVPIIFGPQGDQMAASFRNRVHILPSIDIMRMARVRLDCMSVLFQRKLFLQFAHRRYLLVDSSPQFGFNFLCVKEDRINIPRNFELGSDFRRLYDINAHFESRICPVSTLGLGRASAVRKSINTANIYLMESGRLADFHSLRSEVRGVTSDQGTEKHITEGTVV